MNWQSVTFDWNQARAFLVTAEEGSLSAAARALGLTQPTLSRQVAGLEEALGVTLFERVSKSLVLTEAGMELAEHVRSMGEAAHRISLTASGQSQQIEGLVTISVTDVLAIHLLPDIIRSLRQKAPGIEIRVISTNSLSDLRRREADIAIRHVQPDHPDLYARKLRDAEGNIYAAKTYLARFGGKLSIDDLSGVDVIGFDNNEQLIQYMQSVGLKVTEANIRLSSPSGIVAWEYTRQGLGISPMASEIATRFPEMEAAFDDLPPITFPIWLVTHRELHTSRRIRIVFDHLAEGLLAGSPKRSEKGSS